VSQLLIEWGNIEVNYIWLAIGIIFLSFTIVYFRLAIKSSQKVSLKNIEINKLNEEAFRPRQATGIEVISAGQNTVVRSKGLELIASQLNKVTKDFEQHLNQNIFPKVQKHLDEIYQTSRRGFWIAGILAIISAVLAFLSAFMVL
jgi:hypothetical protein